MAVVRSAHAVSSETMAVAANACFGDELSLFHSFAAACAEQFAKDAAAGQAACEGSDPPALRRVAHNLASVMVMLGHPDLSALATQVEQHAAAGDLSAAAVPWSVLRKALVHLPA